MNCPHCHTTALAAHELEPGLAAQQCPECRGAWVGAADYWAWLRAHGPDQPARPAGEGAPPPAADSDRAMQCPNCGHILLRYKVGQDVSFLLDHCTHCGGIWFDANEWEILKSRNLHDDVHVMFSDVWQARIAQEEHAQEQERIQTKKFGADDLDEVRRIKAWLAGRPLRYELHALLHPDHDV